MEVDEESSSELEDDMEVEEAASPTAATAGPSSSTAAAEQQQQTPVDVPGKAASRQAVATSAYSGEKSAAQQPEGSSSCLQLLAGTSQGTQLLRKVCALLLPAASAEGAAQLQQQLRQGQGQTAAAVLPGGDAQQQLCALLWTLSRPRQYRQRIWLGLSVGVRLVPRLWFSYILPLHQVTPGGLLALSVSSSSSGGAAASSSSSSGGGGWVRPLLVLAQSYSAALSFTHIEDFYADAAPLVPLAQLYDAANPSAGLVMLLKAAVWQVRCGEFCCSSDAECYCRAHVAASKQHKHAVLCVFCSRACLRHVCCHLSLLHVLLPLCRAVCSNCFLGCCSVLTPHFYTPLCCRLRCCAGAVV
jgi:hypothetical protein